MSGASILSIYVDGDLKSLVIISVLADNVSTSRKRVILEVRSREANKTVTVVVKLHRRR